MTNREIPEELRSQMKRDRELIEQELPELAERDARMKEAAAEETLCGTVRRAIHQSRRPLRTIAAEAGISTTVLCDFLEGERTLRSDVLDRLTQAVRAAVSLVPNTSE
jgi:hypothetical protein